VALPALEHCSIGVIGLGYVGLPLTHDEFGSLDRAKLAEWSGNSAVVYDLKYILPRDAVDLRL
jgi:UDP-N-acetyl-D-mannosaminuronate dehydrogenase